ncbi:MAG: TolC family protein [Myxococcus sp.]|nr:TolC family protein [Myxococcus sp.]
MTAAPPLDLSSLGDGAALVPLVWSEAPDLQPWKAQVEVALAARDKTTRLPNPGLDVSLNTLPVGPSNPVDLPQPFLNVPNVQVGVSVLLEVGKRGPRQAAASADVEAVVFQAQAALRSQLLALYDVIGDAAAAEVRVVTLEELLRNAEKLAALQEARAQRGDTSPLDADRARLEQEGAGAQLAEAREQLAEALRGCASVIARPCRPFGDVVKAAAWLDQRFEGSAPVGQRPDLLALEAANRASKAREALALNAALPDPTVRLGYVHDRFLVSGNQMNSLFVGASLPLPVFDRGQDDARAARALVEATEREGAQRVAAARNQLESMGLEVAAAEARQARLKTRALPLATSVVQRLELAVARGAAPLQELLFAQRTRAELTVSAIDVDRRVFHLHVKRARASAAPLPGQELLEVAPRSPP